MGENGCEPKVNAANEPWRLPVDENFVSSWPEDPVVRSAQGRAARMEYAARRLTGEEPGYPLAEYLRDVSAAEREYALSRAEMSMGDSEAFLMPRSKFAHAYMGCVWFAIGGSAAGAERARERVEFLTDEYGFVYGDRYGGAVYARACGFVIAALSQGERA